MSTMYDEQSQADDHIVQIAGKNKAIKSSYLLKAFMAALTTNIFETGPNDF